MRSLSRFVYEYTHVLRTLSASDRIHLLVQTALQSPAILRSGKLRALDAAMSRDITVTFHGHRLNLPLQRIDALVNAGVDDSYTFGTIREMLSDDVYLRAFRPDLRAGTALDLGCNRGFFSLMARVILGASTVIGVEAHAKYAPVQALIAEANHVAPPNTYFKLAGSAAQEKENPRFISMATLMRENHLERIDFAKIDIEGGEAHIFRDPEWLAITQNIAMELHPHFVDTSIVFDALKNSGFECRPTDQFGKPSKPEAAMFLYASRNGSLRN